MRSPIRWNDVMSGATKFPAFGYTDAVRQHRFCVCLCDSAMFLMMPLRPSFFLCLILGYFVQLKYSHQTMGTQRSWTLHAHVCGRHAYALIRAMRRNSTRALGRYKASGQPSGNAFLHTPADEILAMMEHLWRCCLTVQSATTKSVMTPAGKASAAEPKPKHLYWPSTQKHDQAHFCHGSAVETNKWRWQS